MCSLLHLCLMMHLCKWFDQQTPMRAAEQVSSNEIRYLWYNAKFVFGITFCNKNVDSSLDKKVQLWNCWKCRNDLVLLGNSNIKWLLNNQNNFITTPGAGNVIVLWLFQIIACSVNYDKICHRLSNENIIYTAQWNNRYSEHPFL